MGGMAAPAYLIVGGIVLIAGASVLGVAINIITHIGKAMGL